MKACSLKKKAQVLVGAAILVAGSAVANTAKPPQAYIQGLTYNGSGCPSGTLAAKLTDDLNVLELSFDSLIAQVGPGVSLVESRKNCQLNLSVHVPSGWSYSINRIETLGYVSLDAGVTALQTNKYYFQGSRTQASLSSQLKGPVSKDFHFIDSLTTASQVWSPCNVSRNLNINVTAQVTGPVGHSGLIEVDTIRSGDVRRYFLSWRRCT